MDRLIYTALSAMKGTMARQQAIASNLANANTIGFRADIASASALYTSDRPNSARVMSSSEVSAADMSEGQIMETGRALDVALSGGALLTVQADDGEEAYTRRGDLMMSETGVLTNGDGKLVVGEEGPVTIPPADDVKIEADGAIWIVPAGGDPAVPQKIGRLKLVSPVGSEIAKGNDGLFRVKGGGALPQDPQGRLTSGALEGSNVDSTRALVEMIDASRAWETQVRMLTTLRELDDKATQLMQVQA